MQIAILGLGKMGKNLVSKLLSDGHEVVVWNRSREVLEQIRLEKPDFIVTQKLQPVHSIEQLRDTLLKPRILWTMLPAGDPTQNVLDELLDGIVEHGDLVIDGGNAHYKDTQRRAEDFEKKGVKFLGIGVSGGLHGLENGYPLMVGGDKLGYEYITPILDSLAKPNGGHTYFGAGGAGHFVKMVHNGIEYGMMQAIAEGMGILAKSDYKINLIAAGNNWQKGSIVASNLLYFAVAAMVKDPNLTQYNGTISANGEGKWTVEVAKELHVPTPVIEQAVEFRNKSQYDKAIQETVVAKVVAAIRSEFGGHAPNIIEEKK